MGEEQVVDEQLFLEEIVRIGPDFGDHAEVILESLVAAESTAYKTRDVDALHETLIAIVPPALLYAGLTEYPGLVAFGTLIVGGMKYAAHLTMAVYRQNWYDCVARRATRKYDAKREQVTSNYQKSNQEREEKRRGTVRDLEVSGQDYVASLKRYHQMGLINTYISFAVGVTKIDKSFAIRVLEKERAFIDTLCVSVEMEVEQRVNNVNRIYAHEDNELKGVYNAEIGRLNALERKEREEPIRTRVIDRLRTSMYSDAALGMGLFAFTGYVLDSPILGVLSAAVYATYKSVCTYGEKRKIIKRGIAAVTN
jgi:hypothetical protein